jgi:hypothetical protein
MDRPGGVVCARVPEQLARRSEEVAKKHHLALVPEASRA